MQTTSNHRLRRGLPGYLILFDTHAFVPQRQLQFSKLPSQSVFCDISKHFTATHHIPPTSNVLKITSIKGNFTVEPQTFTPDLIMPTHPLNPMNPDNACTLRITAAAGTELAGAYSYGTGKYLHVDIFLPIQKKFTTHRAVFLHVTWLVQTCVH